MWWLRWHIGRFFRSFMKPMDPSEAKRKELKAILLYTIVAWNVAGFGIYMITKDRDENERLKQIDLTPAEKMALRLKVKRVYTLTKDGFVAQDVDQEQKQAEIQERYQRYMERVKKEEAI